jgi:A/G-specific adenine glycosylase
VTDRVYVDEGFRRAFQDRVVGWFRGHGRDLPWRRTSDPYKIAVSEILLQQTQVVRVGPVFVEFVRRYPTVEKLHEAPACEVSALTDPLGYHVRGRWLKALAAVVVNDHGGRIPVVLEEVSRLPGLGPYAAAAVHTFGNRKRAPLVDTNIARVYTRVVGLPADGSVYRDGRRLWELAEILTPGRRFYDYGQGLMDLGSEVCTSRHPKCQTCPLRSICRDVNGGPPVAVWCVKGLSIPAERTTGYRVGSRSTRSRDSTSGS